MRTTPWREIKAKYGKAGPEEEARLEQRVAELRAEMERYQHTLGELRKARGLTQVALAQSLGMTQPEISVLERRSDAYLSTLERYVRGLGGRLELTAVFGDERFELKLQDLVTDGAAETVDTAASKPLVESGAKA